MYNSRVYELQNNYTVTYRLEDSPSKFKRGFEVKLRVKDPVVVKVICFVPKP